MYCLYSCVMNQREKSSMTTTSLIHSVKLSKDKYSHFTDCRCSTHQQLVDTWYVNCVKFQFYWATVCKTVRPMLLVRCLSVLSVTFVHCGQTVGRIKMKLGMQVGLDPGHYVSDGDSAHPPQRGTDPHNFRPMSVVAKWLD